MNYILLLAILAIISIIILALFWFSKRRQAKGSREYWDNGKLRCQYFTKDKNVKSGKETFFYRNGQVNKIRNWHNNELHGVSTVFYNTGEKYLEAIYKNGKLDGAYLVFSKLGLVLKSYLYKDGIKISSKDSFIAETEVSKKSIQVPTINLIDDQLMESFSAATNTYDLVKEQEESKDGDKKKPGVLTGLKKVGKVVSGMDAFQNRKSSKNLKESCERLYETAYAVTEIAREKLNVIINSFGTQRLSSLQKTIGRFLGMLNDMKQENNIKKYEILKGIGIDNQVIEKMKCIDMATSKALKSAATVGSVSVAAAMGTPALVTGAVSVLATASTGTAIGSLSGAAAANATLAWLGGGSLVSGGGGMIAGTALLTTITAGATAGVGLLAAGLIASTYYSKKLTEAKEYQKEVEIKVADMELLWVLLEGINKRTHELSFVTSELEQRLLFQLEFMEPLTVDYDTSDEYYNSIFQKTGILAKSMSELAQTPLLDELGNASSKSAQIIEQTYTVLNKELINHG